MKLMPLIKRSNESTVDYARRLKERYYHSLRKVVPYLREQYRLELLVGPTNCWDQLMAYQIALLKDVGLEPHHKLLDVGCGPLAGGLNFIKYLEVGNYVGVDLRDEPLREAWRLISKHKLTGKHPRVLQSRSFGKDELRAMSFDYVWASQIMYHLDENRTKELFEAVDSFLKPNGRFLFDIIAESEWSNVPEGARWRGFQFHFHRPDHYVELARAYNLTGTVHATLEKYGYPEKEGLRKNAVLVFRRP